MAKRKLTTQQKHRVSNKMQNISSNSGSQVTKKIIKQTNSPLLGKEQLGLVITSFGKRVLVETENGQHFRCAIRQHLGKLVAGDNVIWQTDVEANTGVVVSALPRHHELSRPGFRGLTRMVAANIDFIGIIMPILPSIHPDMIDRYLVAASQLGISAILIINKIDLITDENHWEEINKLLGAYIDMGIKILPASTVSKAGLEEIQAFIQGKNGVFVGPSGAGKSSLINVLIPDLDIRVGALSAATSLGKHTTTNSILYHLPVIGKISGHGGNLIDSPGIRQFSPTACPLDELQSYYPDFVPFLGQCKYNNCTHTIEPHCAIQAAVDNGDIAYSRFQSFQRLLEEFKSEAAYLNQ